MTTINATTDSLTATVHAILGGKFRLRLRNPRARPGQREATVLDDSGEEIGEAYDSTYGGAGFAVHTKPFAGYVALDQIEFVR